MLKEIVAGGLLCMGVGAAAGTWSEVSDDNDARGKLTTITACVQANPGENAVSKALEKCLSDGVPGGKSVKDSNDNKQIHEGNPISYVSALRSSLQHDQNFDGLTVLEWTVATPIVAAGIAAVWLCCCSDECEG